MCKTEQLVVRRAVASSSGVDLMSLLWTKTYPSSIYPHFHHTSKTTERNVFVSCETQMRESVGVTGLVPVTGWHSSNIECLRRGKLSVEHTTCCLSKKKLILLLVCRNLKTQSFNYNIFIVFIFIVSRCRQQWRRRLSTMHDRLTHTKANIRHHLNSPV